MFSRRVLIAATPYGALKPLERHRFACSEGNFTHVQRLWQQRLVVARKKHERSLAVQLFYETLLDNKTNADRTNVLKIHLLEYKESRTDSDGPEFEKTWDDMNTAYETHALLYGCIDI
jgi:hypothetical protein